MPYGWKVFGDGTLPATKGTLAKIATLHSAALSVKLVNTGSTTIKVNLYVNANGTSRRISPKNLELDAQDYWRSDTVELEEGDAIEGEAAVAALVTYIIPGLDRE
jgi:hypothetical protein